MAKSDIQERGFTRLWDDCSSNRVCHSEQRPSLSRCIPLAQLWIWLSTCCKWHNFDTQSWSCRISQCWVHHGVEWDICYHLVWRQQNCLGRVSSFWCGCIIQLVWGEFVGSIRGSCMWGEWKFDWRFEQKWNTWVKCVVCSSLGASRASHHPHIYGSYGTCLQWRLPYCAT